MKQNGLWVIAFVIVALMVLTSVSSLSMNRTETIDNSTYNISDTPPDNPELGDLWFDTTLDEMNIYNGFVWQSLVPTVSGADYKNHVAKHYWGGVDPIYVSKLSPKVLIASEYAISGSGTITDPYIGGIQEALNDLDGGLGVVFLSPALYEIDSTIELVGGQGIVSFMAGWRNCSLATIQLADNSDCTMINVSGSTGNPVTTLFPFISNVCLDGKSTVQGAGNWYGVDVQTTIMDMFFEKVLIHDTKSHAIHVQSGGKQWINDCYLENCKGSGLWVDNGEVRIQGSYVVGNDQYGIRPVGDIQILNNVIRSNDQGGIMGAIRSYDVVINGNKIKDNGLSGAHASNIAFTHAKMLQIENNIFGKHTVAPSVVDDCIYIAGGETDYVCINNNIIKDYLVNPINLALGATNPNGDISHNVYYNTENSGSATIENTNSSVIVTHGMDVTPTSITITGNHSEVSSCWIVNITSTQFEIWVSSAVTYDRIVYWYAEAR